MWRFLACGPDLLTGTDTNTGPGPTAGETWSITATIEDVPISVTSPFGGEKATVSQLTSAWEDKYVEAQSFGIGIEPVLPRFEIQVIVHLDDLPDDTVRFHILDVGTSPYGTLIQNGNDDDNEIPGANVKYWDATGEEWTCSKSSGDQSGAWFEVTSHEDYDGEPLADGTQPRAITRGVFNCTLYAGSAAMDLEDGTFSTLTTTW